MKTMMIEKQFFFTPKIKQLISIQANEQLSYMQTEQGIRAKGPMYVSGNYIDADGNTQEIHETLDMDVLAPSHKLSGDIAFTLRIQEVKGEVHDGALLLYLTIMAEGLKEEKTSDVDEPQEETEVLENEHDEVAEFEDLFEDADCTCTSYRMVVAKIDDTYDTIAQRYNVDVSKLRTYNHDKEIVPKSLLILP